MQNKIAAYKYSIGIFLIIALVAALYLGAYDFEKCHVQVISATGQVDFSFSIGLI